MTGASLDPGPMMAALPLADRFRVWARGTLARGLPEQDESVRLLWAMALGWTTALTGEVSEPFMRTGTMHIFAISGLHIALIAGILVAMLRVLRVSRGVCGWFVIPLIWFYTAATGWQASAIRSTLMMTVIIVGWSLRRPSDLLNSLAAAGFIILLWDPQQLFQAGFQLSFFVVLSIALLLPPIEDVRRRLLETDPLLPPELRPRWRRWLDGPVHFVTTSLATSIAAWLGSMPLIALYFHLFTPVSLLANLVIVPLSSLALACNLGSLLSAWWPWLNELFNYSGWFWMEAMIRLSDWFAVLPGAYFHVPAPDWSGFAVYYALLFGTVTGWLFAPSRRLWAGACIGVLAMVGIIQWINHRDEVCLTVLPLSGGDSIFADAPGRQNDLLIDCGNESASEFVVRPFLRGKGVNRLSQLLLTHGDLRHVGGAGLVEKEFSVRHVLTSNVPFRSAKYREIAGRLNGPSTVEGGSIAAIGLAIGRFSIRPAKIASRKPTTIHWCCAASSTMSVSCSVRIWAGPDKVPCSRRGADLRAEVVVCGIPGHSEPLGDPFLDAVQPRVIIVSAERSARRRNGRPGICVSGWSGAESRCSTPATTAP